MTNINGTPFADVLAAADRIAAHTKRHDGGTFDARTGNVVEVTEGFVVGGAGGFVARTVSVDGDVAGAIASFVQRIPSRLGGEKIHNVGTWIDGGIVFIDTVEVIKNRTTAILVAAERGELAIWDAANGVEITI